MITPFGNDTDGKRQPADIAAPNPLTAYNGYSGSISAGGNSLRGAAQERANGLRNADSVGGMQQQQEDDPFSANIVSNGSYGAGGALPQAMPMTMTQEDMNRSARAARVDWTTNGERLTQGYTEKQNRVSTQPAAEGNFLPPRWVPDDEHLCCASCGKDFDWARRRHHCRGCGKLFCYACTSNRALMPRTFGTRDPQRVCDVCYQRLLPLQDGLVCSMSNAVKDNEIVVGGIQSYLNTPISFTLGAEIRKAAYTIRNFTRPGVVKDKSIPCDLLHKARGLAFLTVAKAGFIFAGRIGSGLVVARTGRTVEGAQAAGAAGGGWSAPTAIGTIGMSWGALVGGEITDFVLILNTDTAVEAFTGKGQATLGAELGVAMGPLGRTGAGNVAVGKEGMAPVYSYSHSRGLFAGISLEGAIISTRPDVNRKFYGRDVTVRELLSGAIAPPPAARPLYDALNEIHV